ncbi:MAG: HEAT repeat domain-containing protein, partial [Candidatus Bipolaricaulota bacterium]|nr:HEAT repeat domain-containing protein [Candidatus Bipolaricaulota bacterium]MDW8127385.1 HEAT repeat domain-containing protein [Candidatus Bipolaricaulota bacterium]
MRKCVVLGLLMAGLVELVALGSTADPWAVRVVEEVVALLEDESPEVREAALAALIQLAELAPDRALPGLTFFAQQGDPKLRERARKRLYRLSPPATPYERVVAILLEPEPDPHLLTEALAPLANEVGNRQLLSTLEKALYEGFSEERSAAILCLAELAMRWEEARHVLGQALLADNLHCDFREEILLAFEKFPDPAPLVPELLKALAKFSRLPHGGSPCESRLAQKILYIFANFEEAVPYLVEALGSPLGAHRQAALAVLAHLGEKARAATPAVLALWERELLPEVRLAALRALGTIGRDDPQALSVLVRATRSRDPQEVAVALEALAQFGAADQEALDAVLLRVNHPLAAVRSAALRVLGLAPAEVAVPSLLAALNDPSAAVRRTAALLLGDLGPQAAAAPALVGLLEDPDPLVREAAGTALGNLADSSEPVIAGLCGRLKDTSFEVRIAAITALGKLGPKAEAALPDLFWLLESEDEALTYTQQKHLQEAVEETLGKIGLGAHINLLQQLPEEDHAAFTNAMERAVRRALEWGLRQATRELADPWSWFARALGIKTYPTFKLSPELDAEIKEII